MIRTKLTIVLLCIMEIIAGSVKEYKTPKSRSVLLKDTVIQRIIGGRLAYPGDFPWQALLKIYKTKKSNNFTSCGGALLYSKWVLTAAHCLEGPFIKVKLGGVSFSDSVYGSRVLKASRAIIHENFILEPLHCDIGLVELSESVEFTDTIQPISLGPLPPENSTVVISGWGKTSNNSHRDSNLRYVDLITISQETCEQTYGNLSLSIFCCVGADLKSTCQGDSGGALVWKDDYRNWIHVGVASFVSEFGCGSEYPMGFTRTNMFAKWIAHKTGCKCDGRDPECCKN